MLACWQGAINPLLTVKTYRYKVDVCTGYNLKKLTKFSHKV